MKPPKLFSICIVSIFFVTAVLPVLYILIAPIFSGQFENIFDSRHLSLAQNSLGIALGATFSALLIGIPVSLLLTRSNISGKQILAPMFVIPALVPPYIHAIAWKQMDRLVPFDIHSLPGVIFVLTLAYFPFVVLMVSGGLKSIDRNMEEASLLIHGGWRTLRKITLPLVFPHIFAGAVFVFIFSIIDFGVPRILGTLYLIIHMNYQ